MSSESFSFEQPRLFTVGAVGEPGGRVFFLQAHAEGTTVSLKCEKQQADALADHLERLLTDLPAVDPDGPPPLIEPLPPMELEWIVGAIGIGYDKDRDRVILELEEVYDVDDDDDASVDAARLRLHLTRAQVAAYVTHTRTLVAA
ncbi:MAG TPA: DUF3090 family protein, partial [Acidimicrobiales bacterium]